MGVEPIARKPAGVFQVKDVWPSVPLLGYFEFYFHAPGADVGFDPEFPSSRDDAVRLRMRNALNVLGFEAADWRQTPTQWQLGVYPPRFRARISVVHEGIDSDRVRPDASARLWLRGGRCFSAEDEVITARNLEPYRGFRCFMRALPLVLRQRPRAEVLIVGGDGVSYGHPLARAPNWRTQLLAELGDRLLSWSLLEAMAAGCLVVGSSTGPVEEVVRDGVNGYLAEMLDAEHLADRILGALPDTGSHGRIRAAARDTIVARYDLRRVCLPAYLGLLRRLTGGGAAL